MLDRTTPLPVQPFGHLSMMPQTVMTLANGLTLHCCSGGDQPVCRLSLLIPGGNAELGAARAALLAEGRIEGTETLSAEDISDRLDFNGVKFSAVTNDHYIVVAVSMLNHRVADTMPLFTEIVSHPTYPDERIEVLRLKLAAELNTRLRRPSFRASAALQPLVFGESHPLAHVMTDDDIRAVSADNLRQTARKAVNPATMHAYLAGRLTPEIIDTVISALSTLTPAEGINLNIVPYTGAVPPLRLDKHHNDTLQTAIACAIAAPRRSHPDYIKLRYTVMALGGYFGSRLMSNIREDKGLTYGIDASLLGARDGSHVLITASCDNASTDIVIEEIDKELRRMAGEPPQGTELEHLRLFAATSLAEDLDSPFAAAAYYSSQIAIGTPPDYFDRQQRELAALTPDTLAQMAQEYLRPDLTLTVTAGPYVK